jgi:hypothetical protein
VVDYISSSSVESGDTNRHSLYVITYRNKVEQYANFNELPEGSPHSAVSQSVQPFADAGARGDVSVHARANNKIGIKLSKKSGFEFAPLVLFTSGLQHTPKHRK